MAPAVLGVAVQRQVREHHAKAVGELLDGRLPLLVRQKGGVEQRERRAGADLAVGDARTVRVVVEAKPHGCILGAPNRRRRRDRPRPRWRPHLQWAAP